MCFVLDTNLRSRDKITTKRSLSSHKLISCWGGACNTKALPHNLYKPYSNQLGKSSAERQRGLWKTALECYRQDTRADCSSKSSELHTTVGAGTHKINKRNVVLAAAEVSGQAGRANRIFVWGKDYRGEGLQKEWCPEHRFVELQSPLRHLHNPGQELNRQGGENPSYRYI